MTKPKSQDLGSVFASPLFRRFLAPIVMTMLGFAMAVYFYAVPFIKTKVYALEEKSVQTNLANIQSLITSNYLAMEAHRKTVTAAHRRELKNIILFTDAYLKNKSDQVRNGLISEDQAQWSALEELRAFRYGSGDFIWVADFNGFYLYHPDPKKNMEDFSEARDVFGNYMLTPLIQKAIEHEEGYHSFWDQRPNDNLPAEKLAYARVFTPWEWVIGTEVFVDDLEAEILLRKEKMIEELRIILKGIVIGNTGFMYIFDSWHNVIIHADSSIENTDMSSVINPSTKHKLVDDLIAASDTVQHKLVVKTTGEGQGQNSQPHEEINWVRHVDGFDWYIVASVNTDELNQSSDVLRNKILLLAAIVVMLSIVVVSLMMGRLLLPVRKLSQVARLVTDGDLSARSDIEGTDEISFLAKAFNAMVGRLKANIDELDQKVLERTQELDSANQELLATVGQLEQHNHEVTELNRMAERLQACYGVDETFSVASEAMAALFPQSSGCLYMVQTGEGEEVFDLVIEWGEVGALEKQLRKEDCLAFSNFKIHITREQTDGPCCLHFVPDVQRLMFCVPLFAQNDVMGMLHLNLSDPGDERQVENLKRLVASATDHLAMSMANLKLRERLQNLSVRDGLTGLFNRRYMEETLSREFKASVRTRHPVGVIILDVDFFKKFNDTYGHEAGDLVLIELGNVLSANVRKEDVVCRFGGEEFVVILPGASPEQSLARAEVLRAKVESDLRLTYHEHDIRVTISLGAASYPEHGNAPDQVLKAADTALYRAKEAGRNRACPATASEE